MHSTDLNTFHTPVTTDQRSLAKRFHSSREVEDILASSFQGVPFKLFNQNTVFIEQTPGGEKFSNWHLSARTFAKDRSAKMIEIWLPTDGKTKPTLS